MDLIEQIEKAEKQAEEIHQDAVREAREMVKSVEEACAGAERDALKTIREDTNKVLEDAKVGAQDDIRTLEVRRSAEREAMRGMAVTHVQAAADRIFERIVLHGDC